MDMAEHEQTWLANHLAHRLKTHKLFYRQHDPLIEIAKMSKLLMASEAGNIKKYANKSLDDISLEGKK